MERLPMFMDWQNYYHENDYTTEAMYRFNAMPLGSKAFFA
jgi:hypothetical protein